MMTKSGYDKDFSVATTVATATQALIIPPSHNMIIMVWQQADFLQENCFWQVSDLDLCYVLQCVSW